MIEHIQVPFLIWTSNPLRFNEGIPFTHYKKISFKLIATELLWFIKGDTNIQYLLKYNNNIWNEWAFENIFNLKIIMVQI